MQLYTALPRAEGCINDKHCCLWRGILLNPAGGFNFYSLNAAPPPPLYFYIHIMPHGFRKHCCIFQTYQPPNPLIKTWVCYLKIFKLSSVFELRRGGFSFRIILFEQQLTSSTNGTHNSGLIAFSIDSSKCISAKKRKDAKIKKGKYLRRRLFCKLFSVL